MSEHPLVKLGRIRIFASSGRSWIRFHRVGDMRGGRPRLKPLARALHRLAHRIYPEPTHTLTVTTGRRSTTFVECRELKP